MLATTITVPTSLQDRINRLKAASVVAPALISTAVRTSAIEVVSGAKDLVPVATGALRRSIQPYFYENGMSAVIGSFLPYAAKQEFDPSLDHSVRPNRVYKRGIRAGLVVQGTAQRNPNATWGFLRKSLAKVEPVFIERLEKIVRMFA